MFVIKPSRFNVRPFVSVCPPLKSLKSPLGPPQAGERLVKMKGDEVIIY